MIDLTLLIALFGVIFSFYQQLQINKICSKCPYYPPNVEIEKKNKINIAS